MTRRRISLRAGLFAEGPSDYDFLAPLVNRLLDSLGSQLYPGAVEVNETLGIDAPRPRPEKRADCIHAAVAEHFGAFTLLIIHAEWVRFEVLRALGAFRRFEADLSEAIQSIASIGRASDGAG